MDSPFARSFIRDSRKRCEWFILFSKRGWLRTHATIQTARYGFQGLFSKVVNRGLTLCQAAFWQRVGYSDMYWRIKECGQLTGLLQRALYSVKSIQNLQPSFNHCITISSSEDWFSGWFLFSGFSQTVNSLTAFLLRYLCETCNKWLYRNHDDYYVILILLK